MKIYLDACCLNRPYDDQTQDRIHLESEAILTIFKHIEAGDWEWIVSSRVGWATALSLPDILNFCNRSNAMAIQQISFQECTTQFSAVFDRVLQNHEVIAVQKAPEQEIVILDAKEYSSLVETLYLLSNPVNADRIREGIAQHQQGLTREIDVKAYLD
ncbi:Antitoxin YefM [Methylococcales bacterium]|nr:Antitoxin YefM [Methylococcales bacterium]